MSGYNITSNYFKDSYLLLYGAGCMGDLLGSLILFSFNKSYKRLPQSSGPDSFYYEPWSKKWLTKDSSFDIFRKFTFGRSDSNFSQVVSQLKSEFQSTIYRFGGLDDPNFDYKINSAASDNEIVTLLPLIVNKDKDRTIPYLFISEVPSDLVIDNQNLNDINFIEAGFLDPKYYCLYILLALYKNRLHFNYDNFHDSFISKEKFISTSLHVITKGRPGVNVNIPIRKMSDQKNYHRIDMLKLILDNDVQGLDILQINDTGIQNMIKLARNDMFEILDFFNLDLNNLPTFDSDLLGKIYDRLPS